MGDNISVIAFWNDYEELAGNARHTLQYVDPYKHRKETTERVFADAKEKYAMAIHLVADSPKSPIG